MVLHLTWQQAALRLALAMVAGTIIGLNRDRSGKPAGLRTVVLVCLASTLAMLQANALLDTSGKSASSFVQADVMRLPLGILSGIGFLGGGAILRRGEFVRGLTTAATLWFVTVLGLLFGGGQIGLGCAGTLIAIVILWVYRYLEMFLRSEHRGTLALSLSPSAPTEEQLRQTLHQTGYALTTWTARYTGPTLSSVRCELRWSAQESREPRTPDFVDSLARTEGITRVVWRA